jgi:hypothetical protein
MRRKGAKNAKETQRRKRRIKKGRDSPHILDPQFFFFSSLRYLRVLRVFAAHLSL